MTSLCLSHALLHSSHLSNYSRNLLVNSNASKTPPHMFRLISSTDQKFLKKLVLLWANWCVMKIWALYTHAILRDVVKASFNVDRSMWIWNRQWFVWCNILVELNNSNLSISRVETVEQTQTDTYIVPRMRIYTT